MNNKAHIEKALREVKNGDRFKVTYTSGEDVKKLVACVIPYEKSAQGKRVLEKREIGKAIYFPADGYGDGVCRLISNPEKGIYFAFQRNMQDEKSGQFTAHERRIMNVGNILEMEKI